MFFINPLVPRLVYKKIHKLALTDYWINFVKDIVDFNTIVSFRDYWVKKVLLVTCVS